jgi:hypothetical protein
MREALRWLRADLQRGLKVAPILAVGSQRAADNISIEGDPHIRCCRGTQRFLLLYRHQRYRQDTLSILRVDFTERARRVDSFRD